MWLSKHRRPVKSTTLSVFRLRISRPNQRPLISGINIYEAHAGRLTWPERMQCLTFYFSRRNYLVYAESALLRVATSFLNDKITLSIRRGLTSQYWSPLSFLLSRGLEHFQTQPSFTAVASRPYYPSTSSPEPEVVRSRVSQIGTLPDLSSSAPHLRPLRMARPAPSDSPNPGYQSGVGNCLFSN
jgi:hypothetical protein